MSRIILFFNRWMKVNFTWSFVILVPPPTSRKTTSLHIWSAGSTVPQKSVSSLSCVLFFKVIIHVPGKINVIYWWVLDLVSVTFIWLYNILNEFRLNVRICGFFKNILQIPLSMRSSFSHKKMSEFILIML